MMFAAERGFTMEDFVDPQMTIRVMQDFKNNMDSPEMERMRAIAQRRQAFTGSLGSTPAAVPSNAEPAGESTFDSLASKIMNRKGLDKKSFDRDDSRPCRRYYTDTRHYDCAEGPVGI